MFDRSKIMKKAWNMKKDLLCRNISATFSDCLRKAWAIAKAEALREEKAASKLIFDEKADMDGFRFILWEKHGLRRIYINNYTGHNKNNRGGYIDLDHGNSIVAVGCVKSAAKRFLDTYRV